MPSFLQNLLSLPAKTKALLAVSGVAILAIALIMLKIATAQVSTVAGTGTLADPASGIDIVGSDSTAHHVATLPPLSEPHAIPKPRAGLA